MIIKIKFTENYNYWITKLFCMDLKYYKIYIKIVSFTKKVIHININKV